jgi:hypothetical protein
LTHPFAWVPAAVAPVAAKIPQPSIAPGHGLLAYRRDTHLPDSQKHTYRCRQQNGSGHAVLSSSLVALRQHIAISAEQSGTAPCRHIGNVPHMRMPDSQCHGSICPGQPKPAKNNFAISGSLTANSCLQHPNSTLPDS